MGFGNAASMVQLLGDCCEVYALKNDLCCTVGTEDKTVLGYLIQTYGYISFKSCYISDQTQRLVPPTEGSGNRLNRARTENRPHQSRDLAAPCQDIRVLCSRSLAGLRHRSEKSCNSCQAAVWKHCDVQQS